MSGWLKAMDRVAPAETTAQLVVVSSRCLQTLARWISARNKCTIAVTNSPLFRRYPRYVQTGSSDACSAVSSILAEEENVSVMFPFKRNHWGKLYASFVGLSGRVSQ